MLPASPSFVTSQLPVVDSGRSWLHNGSSFERRNAALLHGPKNPPFWKDRIVKPAEVLEKIKPGMTIFLGTGMAEPRTLVKELMASDRGNLQDLELIQLVSLGRHGLHRRALFEKIPPQDVLHRLGGKRCHHGGPGRSHPEPLLPDPLALQVRRRSHRRGRHPDHAARREGARKPRSRRGRGTLCHGAGIARGGGDQPGNSPHPRRHLCPRR